MKPLAPVTATTPLVTATIPPFWRTTSAVLRVCAAVSAKQLWTAQICFDRRSRGIYLERLRVIPAV